MYLKDGREILESEKHPGYWIEANTGNYCDEYGHLVGGNEDNGDVPGRTFAFSRMKNRKRDRKAAKEAFFRQFR